MLERARNKRCAQTPYAIVAKVELVVFATGVLQSMDDPRHSSISEVVPNEKYRTLASAVSYEVFAAIVRCISRVHVILEDGGSYGTPR
jgi:hypothetical protein